MDNKIKLLVTQAKFDEVFSIDDWFNFDAMPQNEIYQKMLLFVVDENNEPVGIDKARELFKEVKKSEWLDYLTQFIKAVREAFVNPTNGG
jgi:hypothetical protein